MSTESTPVDEFSAFMSGSTPEDAFSEFWHVKGWGGQTSTPMPTVLIADDAVMIVDGPDILGIKQHGCVEVWTEDGVTHMGNLHESASVKEIRSAAIFWVFGFNEGSIIGHQQLQRKLRDALGLGK